MTRKEFAGFEMRQLIGHWNMGQVILVKQTPCEKH